MGLRGPKPTPTKILQMRGSWRATQRQAEPTVEAKIPPRPAWLTTPEEKKIWRALTTRLHAAGLLSEVDQHALGRYVQLFLQWRKMQQFVAEYGEVYPIMAPDRAKPVGFDIFPQAKLALTLADRLLRLEQHFGMTPSARAALGLMLAQAGKRPSAEGPPSKERFFDTA